MADPQPLKPSVQLLCKLGSIIVHTEELFSENGHTLDRVAMEALLQDYEVQQWIKGMGVYLPKKR